MTVNLSWSARVAMFQIASAHRSFLHRCSPEVDSRLAEADILSADLRRRKLGCHHGFQARVARCEVLLLTAACAVASCRGWLGPVARSTCSSAASATVWGALTSRRSRAACEPSSAFAGLMVRRLSRQLRCVRSPC